MSEEEYKTLMIRVLNVLEDEYEGTNTYDKLLDDVREAAGVPRGKEWWNDIPEHGVLVEAVDMFSGRKLNDMFYVVRECPIQPWNFRPLTNEEIKRFLRQGETR